MRVSAAIVLTMLIATPAMAVDIVSGSGAVVKNGAGLTVVNGDPCSGRMGDECDDRHEDRRDQSPPEVIAAETETTKGEGYGSYRGYQKPQ